MLHSWPTCFLILLGIFQGRPRGCLPVPPRARTQRGVSAWLEVGEFAQTLITSWPSENTGGVDLGFDDCLCHYLGGLPLTL